MGNKGVDVDYEVKDISRHHQPLDHFAIVLYIVFDLKLIVIEKNKMEIKPKRQQQWL